MIDSASRPSRKDPLMHAPGRTVLLAVGRYHFLTARQVTRLLGWETFHQYSQLWLKRLTDARYLVMANWIDSGPGPGGKERVWSLSARGRDALLEMGVELGARTRHSPERAQLFMQHTQAVADCLIACERFATLTPGITLEGFFHDQDLQRRAVKVKTPGDLSGKDTTNVNQDGLIAFDTKRGILALGWEIDRGTEHRQVWQQKVQALIAFAQGPYQAAFGYKSLRVPVYVRTDPYRTKLTADARARQLFDWTEEILEKTKRRNWGTFFAITCVDPAECKPDYFLRGPHWVSPFERAYKPLIPEVIA